MEEQRAFLLWKAITDTKPWIVICILNEHPQLITRGLASGESILMMAVKRKSSVELIKKLIQLMPPEGLAMTDDVQNTVLHIVENTQLATLLVMKSPNLLCVRNSFGETPLMAAINRGCSSDYIVEIIKMTPDEGLSLFDNLGNTVLHLVATIGNIELSELLLMKCPSLLLARNNLKETPLMVAMKGRSSSDYIVEIIKMTPDDGLSLCDNLGNTVLHMAVELAAWPFHSIFPIELSELLLMKCPSLLLARNNLKETPLMVAVKGGSSSDLMKKLIQLTLSDDLAMQDNLENTVLHMAAMTGDIELAELMLMKCPTLLLIRNNSQYLPIHLAVIQGHNDMQEYLLSVAEQQGYNDPYADVTSEDLLHSAIRAGMNDVAVALIYKNPLLASNLLREEENLPAESGEYAKSLLLEAIMNGYLSSVRVILSINPDLTTASLTTSGETPLTVAAKRGSSFDIIKMLIEKTSDVALAKIDRDGNTVLHTLAMHGSTELATLLLKKCPAALLCIHNYSGHVPICIALHHGNRDIAEYLFDKALKQGYDDPFSGSASIDVLCSAIKAGTYELACWLDENYPELAMEDSSVLELLAEGPSAFLALPFSYWKDLLRNLGCISGKHLSPQETFFENMLCSMCDRAAFQGYHKASSLLKEPFLLAARNGTKSMVSKILTCLPDAINFVDGEEHSIFHLAVMYRHKNIFKLAYQNNVEVARRLLLMPDKNGNNVLHLAAYLPHQNRLDQSTRVILQMQRELKWFKELEKLLSPKDIKSKNNLGKTPLAIFNEEHSDLVAKEIQWMTSMASACSVAAPLIATVAFAAAITVPGGSDSNGLPMFSNHKSFRVFAISDAIALFASINCVLSFLAIFTSRYGVDDFLYALPNRLIIGLISLFISAISLMAAFGTTLFLVFGQKNSLILIPIIVLSCAPVIQYAFLQLPSLLNMIKSAYGRKLLA